MFMTNEQLIKKLHAIQRFERMDEGSYCTRYGIVIASPSDHELTVSVDGEEITYEIEPDLGKFVAYGGAFSFDIDRKNTIVHVTFQRILTGQVDDVQGDDITSNGTDFCLKGNVSVINYESRKKAQIMKGCHIAYCVEGDPQSHLIPFAMISETPIIIPLKGHSIQQPYFREEGPKIKISRCENFFIVEDGITVSGEEKILPDGAGNGKGIRVKDWFNLPEEGKWTVLTLKILPPPGKKKVFDFKSYGEKAETKYCEYEEEAYFMSLIPIGTKEILTTYDIWWDDKTTYEGMVVVFENIKERLV